MPVTVELPDLSDLLDGASVANLTERDLLCQ
jgi:hypothetical protein